MKRHIRGSDIRECVKGLAREFRLGREASSLRSVDNQGGELIDWRQQSQTYEECRGNERSAVGSRRRRSSGMRNFARYTKSEELTRMRSRMEQTRRRAGAFDDRELTEVEGSERNERGPQSMQQKRNRKAKEIGAKGGTRNADEAK